MGGGSWESTRNLRLSARDGFLPWLIVAAAAPRPLIYAHEFAWDQEHDPVWQRLQKIYGFYGAQDKLASVHGRGSVRGKPPEATHCNNIGAVHRKGIHAAFAKWFGIEATEYQKRLPAAELQCLTAPAREKFKPKLAHEVAYKNVPLNLIQELTLAGGGTLVDLLANVLRKNLPPMLGLGIRHEPQYETVGEGDWLKHRYKTQIIRHAQEPRIAVPLLWLLPAGANKGRPVVVGVAQDGKAGFLRQRAETITRLLQSGVAVCLPDLRGTGEMRPKDAGRGRTSSDTGISATEWMHGKTVVGRQVEELLLVIDVLRSQGAGPIALWGDSFAPVNAADASLAVPYDAEVQPKLGEPMGGLVAVLTPLFTPKDAVRAVHVHGCLPSYRSALASPFHYIPHDAFIPGILNICDIGEITGSLSQPISVEAGIDAQNRRVQPKELAAAFAVAGGAGSDRLILRNTPATPEVLAAWFVAKLKQGAGR
jgi:hypothetical protein